MGGREYEGEVEKGKQLEKTMELKKCGVRERQSCKKRTKRT